ncbi:hypothetical protein BKP35_06080 [Anaerobacillus arseniciselenatis]|uniref:YitT family protein n=1 Tax=Anaerobacillus arseniciselenatis TaxID=85682 RepID=A0A1S2LTB5_9BACI|nr:YitT family protein [Anaerobacillus arseniciselenatis]OIJ14615.1 hypothetical protein BKP35_06080 [Anaerobacillus arseniciselenatis]
MNDTKRLLAILAGSFIISFGVNNFFVPFHILDGGMIGLGLILHYKFDVSIGITIIILSVPIYIAAWIWYRTFFYNSIVGFVVSSLFIDVFQWLTFDVEHIHPLVGALVGGVLLGIGVGVMFLYDISTGGFDLLAQMIADFIRANVGIIIFFFDLMVVFLGFTVITFDELILSVIAVTATGVATTLIVMFRWENT